MFNEQFLRNTPSALYGTIAKRHKNNDYRTVPWPIAHCHRKTWLFLSRNHGQMTLGGWWKWSRIHLVVAHSFAHVRWGQRQLEHELYGDNLYGIFYGLLHHYVSLRLLMRESPCLQYTLAIKDLH